MAHDVLSPALPLIGQTAVPAIGGAILVFAALHDVAARTIPNRASVALALLGLALRVAYGQLFAGLALGLAVFAAAVFCWQRGWMGGGDVKLLGAAALFVAPDKIGDMLLAITLAGGAIALLYLASGLVLRRRAAAHPAQTPVTQTPARPRHLLARILRAERWRLLRGGSLPYASAIAAGTLFVIVAG